jgi:hypothetical protein
MNQLTVKFGDFFVKIQAHKTVPVKEDTNNAKEDLFAVVFSGVRVVPN